MTPAAAARFEPIDGLIAAARRNGRAALTEPEAKAMLAHAGISVPPERVVQTAREAVRAARAFGFPAVLKITKTTTGRETVATRRAGLQAAG